VQGMILNGRYRLDQQIGEGGMAIVYHGQDLLLNRQVAVKILRAQYASDEGFLKRFEREGQLAAGMSHPNIVSVYDVGSDQGLHYIVMEHIRGPNLKELIRKQGPFSVDGAVFIIAQVASALDYAHQRNLVHRDIKPQNILVDRDGNAKVVDFGIAKGLQDANLTEAGTGMGTVHYVSPEQARGEPATPASDLYSTGIVLFEMLTRSLPFNADTPVGVAMQHVNAAPPRPSSLNPSIPPPVEAIVLRAIAKNPAERYRTGAALESALRHWDNPPPLRQQPSPPPPRQQTAQATTHRQPPPTRPVPPRRTAGTVPPRRRAAPPPPPPRRDEVGCGTWLIGSALLFGVIGFLVLAFQFGPGLFGDAASTPTAQPEATATIESAAVEPTPTEEQVEPTPTAEPEPEPTVEPTPTESPPTPTPEPELARVPDLRNATVDQAESSMTDDWSLVVLNEHSNQIAEGLIIRQEPQPNTPLAPGQDVTVVVSLGPEFLTVPDVRGVPAAQARATLEGLGFEVFEYQEVSSTVAAGLVIRTFPDTSAAAGSEIEMAVSAGDYVEVPNVIGENVIEAIETLQNAGLTVRNVSPQSCAFISQRLDDFDCDTFPSGGVVSATLDWGDVVERNSPIDIAYYDESL
jgi:eukaryotic-like serine/threonine-protein kinase